MAAPAARAAAALDALEALDWAAHPLGPRAGWPEALRVTAELVLACPLPSFVAWGPQHHVIYNDAFVALLGAKHPQAMGAPHLQTWAEAREGLERFVAKVQAGESVLVEDVPFQIVRHGVPEKVWVTFSYTPLRTADGSVAGFHCVTLETTRGLLEQQVRESERRWLAQLFEQAPGFQAVLRGPEHRFDTVNAAYLQLIGRRDVIGLSVQEVLPEVVEQGFIALLDRVYATGEPYVGNAERVLLDRGGERVEAFVDFVYQPIRDARGQTEGVLVHGYEVTERVLADRALASFADSIPAIAWVGSADGQLERFNSQWERYTGVSAAHSLGRNWIEQMHPDDRAGARETWLNAREGNQPWQLEYRLRSATGQWRWFRAQAVPELDRDGKVTRWFGTTTDIEEQRRAADVLRTADRQKDEFIATLAHELRNPLAPIRTAAELLQSPRASEAIKTRAIEVIARQVAQMAHLLDDLMDVARITLRRLVLDIRPIDVRASVHAAVEATQPLIIQRGQTLSVHVAEDLPRVQADSIRVTQILSNILNNAAKYTNPAGHIELHVVQQDASVVFTVIDTGIGMTPLALARIFEMFSQEQAALDRSEGGLGIGLALVKGLVALQQGTITAHSDGPDRGSRFEFRLPVACTDEAVQSASPPQAVPGASAAPRSRTVLLADDNLSALEVLSQLVALAGHQVHRASDGNQALSLASQLRPDVVVLDIGMPGMNGYEVARRIRSEPWGATTQLIAATGWGQRRDRRQADEAGFDAHLTKPFDPRELLRIIDANGGRSVG